MDQISSQDWVTFHKGKEQPEDVSGAWHAIVSQYFGSGLTRNIPHMFRGTLNLVIRKAFIMLPYLVNVYSHTMSGT